jgi:protein O-mannosyl-transferase
MKTADTCAKWHGLWFACALTFGTVLAYLPALRGEFLWDDLNWNRAIGLLLRDPSGLWRIWCEPGALEQYYPLTGTSFWLDHRLWGDRTLPYHLENVLLHALSAILLWQLLLRLEVPGARLAAVIFALHPVMVESVAWITERKNTLSLPFFLGALLACGRWAGWWRDERAPHKAGAWVLALVLFAAALLAKITAFALPAIVLLLCWWKRGAISWKRDVLPMLPFLALSVVMVLVAHRLEVHQLAGSAPEKLMSWPERFVVAGRALWFYPGKLLWPAGLCPVYPRWSPDSGAWRQWLYPATAVTALIILWMKRARVGRGVVVAVLCFAGSLLPVLGFVDLSGMRDASVADRWVYLPSISLLALAAAALAPARRSWVARLAVGVGVIVLAGLTWDQARLYANTRELWSATLRVNPACWSAHNNFGAVLLGEGDSDGAMAHFRRALELKPDYVSARSNLGSVLLKAGKTEEALEEFRLARAADPRDVETRRDIAAALRQAHKEDEAIVEYQEALRIDPRSVPVRQELGNLLLLRGRRDEAVAHFEEILRLDSRNPDACTSLGNAAFLEGRWADAANHFEKARRLGAGNAAALNNLAWLLATAPDAAVRDGARAVGLAVEAVRLDAKKQPAFRLTLAAAYAEAGRFDEALASANEAIALAEAGGNAAMADYLRRQRAILEGRAPLRIQR